jgi:hypothetical protein
MRFVIVLVLFVLSFSTAGITQDTQSGGIFSGSGVAIGAHGDILTNSHVVEDCKKITVRFPSGKSEPASLISRDQKNDLAVVQVKNVVSSVAAFRDGGPLRAGDMVVVSGYPLSGLLATTPNVSVGIVNALAGLGDDSRYLQISAPVQPGNSGGPLLDASGHLVGVVTAKLNAVGIARFTGDIPQNVNFAIKAEVARAFLDSRGISYQTVRSEQQLATADVGDIARPFTAYIECHRALRPVVTGNPPPSKVPSGPPPSQVRSCAETAREFEGRVAVFNAKCTGVGSVSQGALYRECAGEKASLATEQAQICARCPGCK